MIKEQCNCVYHHADSTCRKGMLLLAYKMSADFEYSQAVRDVKATTEEKEKLRLAMQKAEKEWEQHADY